MNKNHVKTRRVAIVAVFCAIAYVVTLAFRIKVASFLTFDLKDSVIAIAAMLFGPAYGAAAALVVATVELFVSDTGFWGWLMNFASSAVFCTVAGGVYSRSRKMSAAIACLVLAVISTVGVMMLLNAFITPIYVGVPRETVVAMIPTLLLPFNTVKAVFNASAVLALYKPISEALKKARLVPRGDDGAKYTLKNRKSIIFLLCSVCIALACALILCFVFDGESVFFR